MNTALLLQIFTAIGGLAGFTAIINLLISRKKIAAESDDIIQNTTDKVIKNLASDNDTLRADVKSARLEVAELRKQSSQLYDLIERMETDEMEMRTVLMRLINWSRRAYDQIIESGIDIDQPPSLEQIRNVINRIGK